MFLVRIMNGRKPRAYRLDDFTLANNPINNFIPVAAVTERHRPRAWWIRPPCLKVIGIAAIGNTVDECHKLIAKLRHAEQLDAPVRENA